MSFIIPEPLMKQRTAKSKPRKSVKFGTQLTMNDAQELAIVSTSVNITKDELDK